MNRRGFSVVESVLILALFTGLAMTVGTYFKNQELLHQMVAQPWLRMAGMIKNGSWAPVAQSDTQHPSHHGRHISLEGDVPQ